MLPLNKKQVKIYLGNDDKKGIPFEWISIGPGWDAQELYCITFEQMEKIREAVIEKQRLVTIEWVGQWKARGEKK